MSSAVDALRARAASGGRALAAGSVLAAVVQVAQLVALARLLDPRAFGVVAMVFVVIAFVQVYTELGVSAAIVQRRDVTREQLSSLYWCGVLAGALAYALLWLAAPLGARLFGVAEVVPLARVAGLALVVAPFGKLFETLLQRELRFEALARQEVAAALVTAVVAVGVTAAGFGVWGPVVGFVAGTAARAALLAAGGLRSMRPLARLRLADVRGFAGYGLYQMGEHTVNFAAGRSDQLIVGAVLGPAALGYYNFGISLTSHPTSRINPVATRVALPVLSRLQDDREHLGAEYLRLLRMLVGVTAPLLVGLAAVAPTLVPLVFGGEWRGAVPVVQVLCLVALSRSMGNPVGSLLLARGRADLGFRWNVVLLAVTVPAVAAAALLGGLLSVAVVLLAIQGVFQVAAYFVLIRPITGRMGGAYADALLRAAALAAAMGAVVLALGLIPLAPPARLAVQVAAGAVVYALVLGRFEPRTVVDLRALLGARA